MAGLKGDMGVVSAIQPVAVDLSFGTILKHLKFAAMGSFDARKDRLVLSGDLLYLKLSASDNIDIREIDFLDAKLKSTTFITTLTAGYRAVDQGPLFVDVFAGGRIDSMKTGLDLNGPTRSFSGSKRATWFDPIIGVRFEAPLGPGWTVRTYGDIGGFGVGSHSTWQLRGEIHYDVSQHWALTAGWRHLKINYDHNGYVFDAAMDGPILGAIYRF
jgi:hypothetical protein